jgi:hypothetical protein
VGCVKNAFPGAFVDVRWSDLFVSLLGNLCRRALKTVLTLLCIHQTFAKVLNGKKVSLCKRQGDFITHRLSKEPILKVRVFPTLNVGVQAEKSMVREW